MNTQCLTQQIDKDLISGKPVIKVGDSVIYEGQINAMMEVLPGFRAGWQSDEQRVELAKSIIEQELFLNAARKANLLSENKRLQKNLWVQIRNYQAGTYLLQEVDKKAKDQYEKDKLKLYTEVEIKDIVVYFENTGGKDDAEKQKIALKKAEVIEKKLTPDNFSQIAADSTENPIAKANGGDIGAVSMLDERIKFLDWQPLVDEAFRLKKGEVSKQIVTRDGVHIIQVVSEKRVQSFEDVLPVIRNQIEAEVKAELLAKMRSENTIEYLDESLRPKPETEQTSTQ